MSVITFKLSSQFHMSLIAAPQAGVHWLLFRDLQPLVYDVRNRDTPTSGYMTRNFDIPVQVVNSKTVLLSGGLSIDIGRLCFCIRVFSYFNVLNYCCYLSFIFARFCVAFSDLLFGMPFNLIKKKLKKELKDFFFFQFKTNSAELFYFIFLLQPSDSTILHCV